MHLLDDRMPAVDPVGGNGVKVCGVGGGEKCVEPPHVEQLALSLVFLRSQVRDTADDQPAGDVVGFLLRGERGERKFGDFGDRDPPLRLFVEGGVGVFDRRAGIVGDGADRGSDHRVQSGGDRDVCAAADCRTDGGIPEECRICAHQGFRYRLRLSVIDCVVAGMAAAARMRPTVVRVSAAIHPCCSRAEPHDPLRRRCPVTTGAAALVLTVVIREFRPRIPE